MDIEIARRFFENEDYKNSLKFFNYVIENEKDNSEAFSGRGLCLRALLQIDNAILDFGKAIELDSQNHEAYYERGGILLEKRELEKAKIDFEKALEIFGGHMDYLLAVAVVNYNLRNFSEVVKYARRLVELNDRDLSSLDLLASSLLETGNCEESIRIYTQIVQVDPENSGWFNGLGYALSRCGRYKEAIPYFDAAIIYNSIMAYSYDNRGFCKFKLNDWRGGMRDVVESLKLDPSNSYAYKIKGIIHQEMGEDTEAMECYQMAEKLGYKGNYGDEVEKLIAQFGC